MASLRSTSRLTNYDVFLSFRGEDTRKTFVDHLYSALVQQGIYTYKDDETLARGELIGPSLMKAIEESQIAVVVLSENYADSSWCLDELVYIMKCKEGRGHTVLPVFYHVDPSEVRKQKRKYEEAFAKHELENNKVKVELWRKALVDASNISGWEPRYVANGHEAKCIKEIVDTITHILRPVISSADENLIGIKARVQVLISKLDIGSGGVLMVGIWGVGGGGKTTLASSAYDEIFGSFDGCCFVESIREESTNKNGLKELQEKILSDVLKQDQVRIGRVEEGRRMIKNRLCRRKVLIVLDDVNHLDHLNALAGSHDWFGEGSRIIITTRDGHLLNAHRVNVIHDISLLNDDEAIKLFHKHAYRVNNRPIEEYEMLVKGVVSYANGLPLALKVLGSFLCDKSMNEWKSALARLKEIPHNDILGKLKISFDGLQPDEKQLFLDIACFFRGKKKYDAMEILDGCGFHSAIGIRVLIEKALITVVRGEFNMHDLVQEMAHYIVREEDPKNPEKHSRVWKKEDVGKICALNAMTELDKINAIRVFDDKYDPLPCHHHEVVAKMKKLRWIDWKGLSASSLPTNFPAGELCCLILSECEQRLLWEGYKYLPNLRVIKLDYLKNLVETPDFNGLPNLERLYLHNSWILEEIHPSVGSLKRLVCLSINWCMNFKTLPPITLSHNLETFDISHCVKLLKVTEPEQNNDDETDSKCCSDKEHSLPDNINNNTNHVGLLFFHKALTKLTLSRCNLGDEDIDDSVVWELSSLVELNLSLNKFSRLNFGLWQLPRLKLLNVASCRNLEELSGLPSSIAFLIAYWCDSLESIGDISNCKWLWKVSFLKYHNVCQLHGNEILDSMLQGNAVEDHFISFTLPTHQILTEILSMTFAKRTFTLRLPHNWYNEYSGFLMRIAYNYPCNVTISIDELDRDSQSEVWQEFSKATPPYYASSTTYVGYVSFNSLMRHASWLNLEFNTISFSLDNDFGPSYESRFAVELVPRNSKGDPVQTTKVATNISDYYYDEEVVDGNTFAFQHHSNSSIKILWVLCPT